MLEKNRGNNTGIGTAGVGYVIIPDNVDSIVDYVQKCYRNHMISINGGIGYTNFHNVKITVDALNQIKFPTEGSEGSAVVWVRESSYNKPVVIGVLKSTKDSGFTTKGQQRIVQEVADKIAEVFLDASNGRININLFNDKKVSGEINIKISGNPESDKINIESDDEINNSCETFNVNCSKDFNLTINNGLIDILSIVANEDEFHIKDQFGNESIFNKDNVQIITQKFNVATGKEKMVLGDTLKKILEELIDAINSLTVSTPHGPSGTPLNAATFSSIKGKLDTILSQISNTD